MEIYKINYSQLQVELLPPIYRVEKQSVWVSCLVRPVQESRDYMFNVFRPQVLKQAKQNSQVMVLEANLNETFPSSDTIYISSAFAGGDRVYLYREDEDIISAYLHTQAEGIPLYLYTKEEYFPSVDFIVNVPQELQPKQSQIHALINRYKLSGIQHEIRWY